MFDDDDWRAGRNLHRYDAIHNPERRQVGAVWRLTLCGLTRADVLGLRWADIDSEAGVVRVS